MSEDVLRRAAALMRERAQAATPGPWEVAPASEPYFRQPSVLAREQGINEEWVAECKSERNHGREDAAHIASWSPAVALVVADWLDLIARELESGALYDLPTAPECEAAHAVATAYLGEA